jgi:hypothetical protein
MVQRLQKSHLPFEPLEHPPINKVLPRADLARKNLKRIIPK